MPGDLFAAILVSDRLLDATSDRAWVEAMLRFEAALATGSAACQLIPPAAAQAICLACAELSSSVDPAALGRQARAGVSPAIPLVDQLRSAVPSEAAGWVHHGATSQDTVDSAAMLIARAALDTIEQDVVGFTAACARLARLHRDTPLVARTLMQAAVPSTFGLKAAGWLVAALDARARLAVARGRLSLQLGGPAGTQAAWGNRAPEVAGAVAAELGLAVPVLPWHTARGRVVELAGALSEMAGVAGKAATDVVLMAQSEVSEVSEAVPGGSSSMAHKRNPAGAIEAAAAARIAHGAAGSLLYCMEQEHERAAGAWQAEWTTLTDLLRFAGGAIGSIHRVLAGLRVHPDAMRRNLETGLAPEVRAELDPHVSAAGRLVDSALDFYGAPGGSDR